MARRASRSSEQGPLKDVLGATAFVLGDRVEVLQEEENSASDDEAPETSPSDPDPHDEPAHESSPSDPDPHDEAAHEPSGPTPATHLYAGDDTAAYVCCGLIPATTASRNSPMASEPALAGAIGDSASLELASPGNGARLADDSAACNTASVPVESCCAFLSECSGVANPCQVRAHTVAPGLAKARVKRPQPKEEVWVPATISNVRTRVHPASGETLAEAYDVLYDAADNVSDDDDGGKAGKSGGGRGGGRGGGASGGPGSPGAGLAGLADGEVGVTPGSGRLRRNAVDGAAYAREREARRALRRSALAATAKVRVTRGAAAAGACLPGSSVVCDFGDAGYFRGTVGQACSHKSVPGYFEVAFSDGSVEEVQWFEIAKMQAERPPLGEGYTVPCPDWQPPRRARRHGSGGKQRFHQNQQQSHERRRTADPTPSSRVRGSPGDGGSKGRFMYGWARKPLAASGDRGSESPSQASKGDEEDGDERIEPLAAAASAITEVWLECEACGKWRKLPPGATAESAHDAAASAAAGETAQEGGLARWVCSLNVLDPSRQSCDVDEESWECAAAGVGEKVFEYSEGDGTVSMSANTIASADAGHGGYRFNAANVMLAATNGPEVAAAGDYELFAMSDHDVAAVFSETIAAVKAQGVASGACAQVAGAKGATEALEEGLPPSRIVETASVGAVSSGFARDSDVSISPLARGPLRPHTLGDATSEAREGEEPEEEKEAEEEDEEEDFDVPEAKLTGEELFQRLAAVAAKHITSGGEGGEGSQGSGSGSGGGSRRASRAMGSALGGTVGAWAQTFKQKKRAAAHAASSGGVASTQQQLGRDLGGGLGWRCGGCGALNARGSAKHGLSAQRRTCFRCGEWASVEAEAAARAEMAARKAAMIRPPRASGQPSAVARGGGAGRNGGGVEESKEPEEEDDDEDVDYSDEARRWGLAAAAARGETAAAKRFKKKTARPVPKRRLPGFTVSFSLFDGGGGAYPYYRLCALRGVRALAAGLRTLGLDDDADGEDDEDEVEKDDDDAHNEDDDGGMRVRQQRSRRVSFVAHLDHLVDDSTLRDLFVASGGRLRAVRYSMTGAAKAYAKTCWLVSAMRYRTLWETEAASQSGGGGRGGERGGGGGGDTVVSLDIHDDSALQLAEILRLERRLEEEGKQAAFTYWRAGGNTCENGSAVPVRLGVGGAHAHRDGGMIVWRAHSEALAGKASQRNVPATMAETKTTTSTTAAAAALAATTALTPVGFGVVTTGVSSTSVGVDNSDAAFATDPPLETSAATDATTDIASSPGRLMVTPVGRSVAGAAVSAGEGNDTGVIEGAPEGATNGDARAAVRSRSGFGSFTDYVQGALKGCSHDHLRGCDEMLLDGFLHGALDPTTCLWQKHSHAIRATPDSEGKKTALSPKKNRHSRKSRGSCDDDSGDESSDGDSDGDGGRPVGIKVGWVHLDIGDGLASAQILCCPEEHPRKKYRRSMSIPTIASLASTTVKTTTAAAKSAVTKCHNAKRPAPGAAARGSSKSSSGSSANGKRAKALL